MHFCRSSAAFRLCWALVLAHSTAAFSTEGGDDSVDPALSVTTVGGNVVLSWPAWASGWALEEAPHLRQPVPWTQLSSSLYQSNLLSRYVAVPAQNAPRFYRLRRLGPPVPGLAGRWPLDEGIGQVSEGMVPGTSLSLQDIDWSPGRFGSRALAFNGLAATSGGSRAWITNAGFRVLPPRGRPFSLSLWLNPDALTTGWQGLIGQTGSPTNRWSVALHNVGTGTNCIVVNATDASASLSMTGRALLLPGQWRQLTIAHDGSQASLFLDTTRIAHQLLPLPISDGAIYFGGGIDDHPSFLGRIDDLRTYTNSLTHEDVSLTGHWRFNENNDRFTIDRSTRGNHAGLTGGAGWVPGHDGSGIDLSSTAVVLGNSHFEVLPPSGGAFTVSFWLRPNVLTTGHSRLIGTDDVNGGWEAFLSAGQPGTAALVLSSTNSGGTLGLSVPLALTNGVWTRLCITYNGGIATVYQDGRKLRAANGAIRASRAPIVIGASAGMPSIDAVIDDLKVYGRELEQTEIGPLASTMWETVMISGTTNILLQGTGPPGKTLSYSILSLPTNGTLVHTNGSAIVTYQAGAQKGPDSFIYTVTDGEYTSQPAVVTMSIVRPHWLSPTGGSVQPLDGSRPSQAWAAGTASALDAIWRTNTYYDCFFYAPGVYETTGWKAPDRTTARPGCKHVGAGMSNTVVRLVNAWDSWTEGVIFGISDVLSFCHGFEVHDMTLDCNGDNNPKLAVGEPIWLRIPLESVARVETLTLRWSHAELPGSGRGPFHAGRAAEFNVCAWNSLQGTSNCTSFVSTGEVDVVQIDAEADELILTMTRRATGIDFYGLTQIDLTGGAASLPSAKTPAGIESKLDLEHSALLAADRDQETAWASDSESEVEVAFPLSAGTTISQLNLHWNCKTVNQNTRLGPAAQFTIRARNEQTGEHYPVPFVRHSRAADGRETVTFGNAQSTNAITTDRLVLVLTEREPTVNCYSLREVTFQNYSTPVPLRLPSARNSLGWAGNHAIMRAFDSDETTQWASATQGMIGATALAGNNMKFTRLKVKGFGTRATRECFPMFLAHPSVPGFTSHSGNVLVEDCIFTEPATNNTDGLTTVTVIANLPGSITNAIVRRCSVIGVKADFSYSHAFSAVHVEDCFVHDCDTGVYWEPTPGWVDDYGQTLIRSNRFFNVYYGVFVLGHPGSLFDSITMMDNEIVLSESIGWGFATCDVCAPGPSGSITNVTILNNIIRYPDWGTQSSAQHGGVYCSDIKNAVIGNNLITMGTPSSLRVRICPGGWIPPSVPKETCEFNDPGPPGPVSYPPCLDVLPAGYRRAWFNNRTLTGSLLDVRFQNWGFDGWAFQQQWPE